MWLNDYKKDKNSKFDDLKRQLGNVCYKYETEAAELRREISKEIGYIDYINSEIHNYSKFKLDEIVPYIVRLLMQFSEDEYVFHKAKVMIVQGYYNTNKDNKDNVINYKEEQKEIYMISKEKDKKESYEASYFPEYSENPLEENHIILGERQSFSFYDINGEETKFMKRYPYIKEFIDILIDIKNRSSKYSLSENEFERAYTVTIEKYNSTMKKVKVKI